MFHGPNKKVTYGLLISANKKANKCIQCKQVYSANKKVTYGLLIRQCIQCVNSANKKVMYGLLIRKPP